MHPEVAASKPNALELAVLERLLAGDHPVLRVLRAQAARISVARREHTGVGFFTDFTLPGDDVPLTPVESLRFGDVVAAIPGLQHGAGFLLFVDGGRMSMLEGYSFGEPWPEDTSGVVLRYVAEDRRGALAKLG